MRRASVAQIRRLPSRARNAHEIRACRELPESSPAALAAQKGNKSAGVERKAPEKAPDCSPPVRARASTFPAKKTPVPLTTAPRQGAPCGENVRGRSGDDEWHTPAEIFPL